MSDKNGIYWIHFELSETFLPAEQNALAQRILHEITYKPGVKRASMSPNWGIVKSLTKAIEDEINSYSTMETPQCKRPQ